MLIEKIRRGVLEVQTDKGLRYLRPSLAERIRLLWTFRNFKLLPQQVLTQREVALVTALLERGKFQRKADCRIGIIEWDAAPPAPDPESSAKLVPPEEATTNASSTATPATSNNRRARRRRERKRSQGAAPFQTDIAPACPARPR